MSKEIKIPGIGRVGLANPLFHEKSGFGTGRIDAAGSSRPQGHLALQVIDKNGNPKKASEVMSRSARFWNNIRNNDLSIDLGSGLVTNVGVLGMAAGFSFANPSGAGSTVLGLAKFHCSGTGTTAAAATDIKLQTPSGFGGQTPVAGTQVLVSAANSQKYQTVATIAYTGTEAVTEWGLLVTGTLTATTGSPFTAGSATTGTVTATPLTASSSTVLGQQLTIFEDTAAGSLSWGLVTSNTTGVITVPAWYKVADGTAGTAPVNTDPYIIRPIMLDHKVFSAINVASGDSIQYTYTLTINSGG